MTSFQVRSYAYDSTSSSYSHMKQQGLTRCLKNTEYTHRRKKKSNGC